MLDATASQYETDTLRRKCLLYRHSRAQGYIPTPTSQQHHVRPECCSGWWCSLASSEPSLPFGAGQNMLPKTNHCFSCPSSGSVTLLPAFPFQARPAPLDSEKTRLLLMPTPPRSHLRRALGTSRERLACLGAQIHTVLSVLSDRLRWPPILVSALSFATGIALLPRLPRSFHLPKRNSLDKIQSWDCSAQQLHI